MGFEYAFELPPRCEDAPKPSGKTTRRLTTPDGAHWFEVRGGGSQVEGKYLQWCQSQLEQAVKQHASGALDAAGLEAAEMAYNAAFATYVADRVVDHNLTDDDGEKLPVGLGLFWALPAGDALRLVFRIQNRESIWADPKAGASSTTG